MQKAVTVDDILAVQTQLTNTAGQIETTKGRMQYLEQTSAMSLITVNLQQSTLTISLYAGTTYARTKDNIGFAVDIQGGISPFSYHGTLVTPLKASKQRRGINTKRQVIIPLVLP